MTTTTIWKAGDRLETLVDNVRHLGTVMFVRRDGLARVAYDTKEDAWMVLPGKRQGQMWTSAQSSAFDLCHSVHAFSLKEIVEAMLAIASRYKDVTTGSNSSSSRYKRRRL